MSDFRIKDAGQRTMEAILAGLNCGASATANKRAALLQQGRLKEGVYGVL